MEENNETEQSTQDTGASADTSKESNGGDSAATKPWTEGMDEKTVQYLSSNGLDKMTQPEAFSNVLNSYRQLEKKHGVSADRLIVKPDGDDPDQMNRFYKSLGRPEDITGYASPEGGDFDESFVDSIKQSFFDSGLTEHQASGIMSKYQELTTATLETAQNELKLQQESSIGELKKDWGSDFDRRITEAGRYASQVGLPDDVIDAIENGSGSKALLEWTYKQSLDSASGDTVNTQSSTFTTPTEAAGQRQRLSDEISVDPARLNAYNRGKGSDYEKMQKLLSLSVQTG